MPMSEKLIPAFAYGVSFGTLFYILGTVANVVVPGVNAAAAGVLGFASAVAVHLSSK